MTYIIKNRNNGYRKIILSVSIVFICLFIILQYFWPSFISSIFMTIARPYWRAEFAIESGSLHSIDSLLKENELLKQKIADDETKLAIVESVNSENAELRKLLQISSSTNSTLFVVAPVIKKPPFGIYDELIIDIGKDKGVSTTSLVYASDNVPIGRVVDVFSQTSKVILFSSPGQKHDVLLSNKIPAVAIGRGGGQYEVSVPRGLNIALGDFVSYANLDVRPMGKIIYIDSNESLPFEKVLFSAPINIYELRWVTVGISKTKKDL
jgi:cell shape-determining protein MreC